MKGSQPLLPALARQLVRPSGPVGRLLVARMLNKLDRPMMSSRSSRAPGKSGPTPASVAVSRWSYC